MLSTLFLSVFILTGSFQESHSRPDELNEIHTISNEIHNLKRAAFLDKNIDKISKNYFFNVPDSMAANSLSSRYRRDSSSQIHIEYQKEKLELIKDETDHLLGLAISTSWDYVNNHNNTVGIAALKANREYVEKSTIYNKRLAELKEFSDIQNKISADNITKEYEEQKEKLHIINNGFIKFDHLFNMTNRYYDIHEKNHLLNNLTTEYNTLHNISLLEDAHKEGVIVRNMVQKQLEEAIAVHDFMERNYVQGFFVTNFTEKLLDIKLWKDILDNKTKELLNIEKQIKEEPSKVVLKDYVQPILIIIMFVIGFISNLVFLLILICQKHSRTAWDFMLMNLALGNILVIIVNIPISYKDTTSSWEHSEELCIAFRFFRQLFISVCVYSVVLMSVQRLLSALDFKWHGNEYRVETILSVVLRIVTVWFIGSLIATPHSIYSGIFDGKCYAASPQMYKNFPKMIFIFDMFVFCIVPIVIIILSSVSSTKIINESFKKSPDKIISLSKETHPQLFNLNVIVVLTVLFTISYLPFYTFLLLCAWIDFSVDILLYDILFFVIHVLFLGYFCFSPVFLYITSQSYRYYCNTYILCRRKKEGEYKHTPRKLSQDSETTKL